MYQFLIFCHKQFVLSCICYAIEIDSIMERNSVEDGELNVWRILPLPLISGENVCEFSGIDKVTAEKHIKVWHMPLGCGQYHARHGK